MAIQCIWNLDPSGHWNATGERIVACRCISSVLPMVIQCVPNYANYLWIATVTPPGDSIHQCTRSSSGLPAYYSLANELWVMTCGPLGDSRRQCGSSEVCPVVSHCTSGFLVCSNYANWHWITLWELKIMRVSIECNFIIYTFMYV